MLDTFRQWRRRSLANTFAVRAAMVTVTSVLMVAGVSLAIIYWTEQRAVESALQHHAETAAERVEAPLKVIARDIAELAGSPMFATALLDSGGRAAYARPFLHNYRFPVVAANGLALCDINGQLLAGSQSLADCGADQSTFTQVLADGQQRQVWQLAAGRRQWIVYQGVTFAYTGTTEGLLVARIDLDDLLRPLAGELNLAAVDLRPAMGIADSPVPADTVRKTLCRGETVADGVPLELVVTARPQSLWTLLLPLLSGYLLATLALLAVILLWARRDSRELIQPLATLRDRAREIAASADLTVPIPLAGNDEVGQLAESIAAMVAALRGTESERQESEARFRLIFDKSNEAILFGSPDGGIEAANPAACQLFGYNEAAFHALGRSGVMDTGDPRLPAALEERRRTGMFRGELRCRHADGHLFPIEVVSTLFVDTQGIARTSNLFRDISERIAAERERAAAARRLVAVQEDTRRRLARELHDRTSPNLAAISINLESAVIAFDASNWPRVAEYMADNRALLEDTAIGIREICSDLRPPALDYAGLAAAIDSYAEQFSQRTGIAVIRASLERTRRAPADVESMLFRIVQEALTNTAKHAQAGTVTLTLAIDTQTIALTVSDDGRGFAPDQTAGHSGLGLINMREMAEFVGGHFSIASHPGQGTRICVDIALAQPPE